MTGKTDKYDCQCHNCLTSISLRHCPKQEAQAEFNTLLEAIEEIHATICPKQEGTWQEMARQILQTLSKSKEMTAIARRTE